MPNALDPALLHPRHSAAVDFPTWIYIFPPSLFASFLSSTLMAEVYWTDFLPQLVGHPVAIERLRNIFQNIVLHPEEPKYKSIRLANEKFNADVVSVSGGAGVALMKSLGFVEDAGSIVFRGIAPENPSHSIDTLSAAVDALNELLPPPTAPPSMPPSGAAGPAEQRWRQQQEAARLLQQQREERERLHRQLQLDKLDRESEKKTKAGLQISTRAHTLPVSGMHDSAPGGAPHDVVEIGSVQEMDKLMSKFSNMLIVVDAKADWCGPCKMMAPVFHGLAAEFAGKAVLASFDVDAVPELAARYRISAMPTFVFIKNSQMVDSMRGANPAGLKEKIIALL